MPEPAEVVDGAAGTELEVVVLGAEVVVAELEGVELVVVEEEATAGRVDGLESLWTARPTTAATSRAPIPPPTTITGVDAPGALPKSRTTHQCLVDGRPLSGRYWPVSD